MFGKERRKDMDISEFSKVRSLWEEIMVKFQKEGYWLFDEG